MWLREFLNDSVAYYGLDHAKRDDNTIVCDLNSREFPDMKADAAFCSGCFEYIDEDNVNWFMEKVSETSPVLIMSYCTLENLSSIYKRKMELWKNHMHREEVIKLAEQFGFRLEVHRIWNRTEIFKFVR